MKTPFEIYCKTRRKDPDISIIKLYAERLTWEKDNDVKKFLYKTIETHLEILQNKLRELY